MASKIEFVVDVKENEKYFYRLSTDVGSIFFIGSVAIATINGYFGQVTEEFAISEMKSLLYSGNWP